MPCLNIGNVIVCTSPWFRLRLDDGRHVFMYWHSYLGPAFYPDRNQARMIDGWWEDEAICRALDWFIGRGHRA